jgi:hypothetical protein
LHNSKKYAIITITHNIHCMDPLLTGLLIMLALFAVFVFSEDFIRKKFKKKEAKPEKDDVKAPEQLKEKGIDIKQLQLTSSQLSKKITENNNNINQINQLMNKGNSRPANAR